MSHERLTRPEVERLFELYQHAGTGGHRRWAQEYERDLAYVQSGHCFDCDPGVVGLDAMRPMWHDREPAGAVNVPAERRVNAQAERRQYDQREHRRPITRKTLASGHEVCADDRRKRVRAC